MPKDGRGVSVRWLLLGAVVSAALAPVSVRADENLCPGGSQPRRQATAEAEAKWCERDGKREGPWSETDLQGRALKKASYSRGLLDGKYDEWFPNGQKRTEGLYRAGKKTGVWLSWYEDGKLKEQSSWVEERREGFSQAWDELGGVASQGSYVAGQKDGLWTQWSQDGSIQARELYQQGKLLRSLAPSEPTPPSSRVRPLLSGIQGTVTLKTEAGTQVGRELQEFEFRVRVVTGPKSFATVTYPDASKLEIAESSDIEIQDRDPGSQRNFLHSGSVHGSVTKASASKAAGATPAKPRFIIRTKVATMGVRGTEFVFDSDAEGGKAQLHTLEGEVQIAASEDELMSGKGTAVREAQYVQAAEGAISPPARFDPDAFRKAFAGKYSAEASAPEEPEEPFLSLLHFRLSPTWVRQRNGGRVYTLNASFNPRMHLFWRLGLVGHAGLMPLLDGATQERFLATELGLLASVRLFGPVTLEAGVGVQKWAGKLDADGLPMANLGWRERQPQGMLRMVYVGVSEFESGQNTALQLRAGLEFGF